MSGGLPHLDLRIVKYNVTEFQMGSDLIRMVRVYSGRDLIDVWGLSHFKKVCIKYSEIEIQLGGSLISSVFLKLMGSVYRKL